MKGLFHKIHSFGKKVGSAVSSGLSLGKKVVGAVDKIHGKIKHAIGIASSVANVLPVPAGLKNVLSKVQDVSAKVDKGSAMVKKGIERGSQLQDKAGKVGSILQAAKLGKEAFGAGRAGLKTTRTFLGRPGAGDKVSGRQLVLDPGVSAGVRAAARKNTTRKGRGIRR